MKKTFAIGALSTLLIVSGSATAFAEYGNSKQISSTISPTTPVKVTIGNEQDFIQVLSRAPEMDNYIFLGKDNLLHLDPKAKKIVGQAVYNKFVMGVNSINDAIRTGQIKNENGKFTSNISQNLTPGQISPQYHTGTYWWGIAVTYTESETKALEHAVVSGANTYTLGAALAAFIPGGEAVAAAAAIVAYGSYQLANDMQYYDRGYGVTLNFHWLPLPWVTVSSN